MKILVLILSILTSLHYLQTGAALVNFTEDCPKHILTPYLDGLMAKLEGILSAKFKELVEKGTKLVLEQVVTTIASVADTAEKEFIDYYDRLMPCLKYIIQNANKEELKLLRGTFVLFCYFLVACIKFLVAFYFSHRF